MDLFRQALPLFYFIIFVIKMEGELFSGQLVLDCSDRGLPASTGTEISIIRRRARSVCQIIFLPRTTYTGCTPPLSDEERERGKLVFGFIRMDGNRGLIYIAGRLPRVFRSFVSGHSEFEIWPRVASLFVCVCVFCFLLFNYSCGE